MTPYDTYCQYLALKNHLTKPSYNYHKYNGKVSASVRSFESRRDRYHFEKLAKKRDAFGFLLANLIQNPSVWVGELVSSEQAESTYREWQKRNQSLSYTFKEELKRLEGEFDSNFRCESGRHPPLLRAYLDKRVSIETLIILLHLTGCYSKWQKSMEYDPIWRGVALIVLKYQPFMKYDVDKFKQIVLDYYDE